MIFKNSDREFKFDYYEFFDFASNKFTRLFLRILKRINYFKYSNKSMNYLNLYNALGSRLKRLYGSTKTSCHTRFAVHTKLGFPFRKNINV